MFWKSVELSTTTKTTTTTTATTTPILTFEEYVFVTASPHFQNSYERFRSCTALSVGLQHKSVKGFVAQKKKRKREKRKKKREKRKKMKRRKRREEGIKGGEKSKRKKNGNQFGFCLVGQT